VAIPVVKEKKTSTVKRIHKRAEGRKNAIEASKIQLEREGVGERCVKKKKRIFLSTGEGEFKGGELGEGGKRKTECDATEERTKKEGGR